MSAASIAGPLSGAEPTFSFEFFPPKSDRGEEMLWETIHELEGLKPTFVSVTYGAGGTTRERTVRITARIAAATSLTPVGHLTCVGQSREALSDVVNQYADAGVTHVLALRGDPEGGPGEPWKSHPGGLDRAVDLVELVRATRSEVHVGVAAFPEGHPEASDLDADADVLVAKADAGASFAVTQFFYTTDDYCDLVDRVRARGCELPIVPGIMPIENPRQVERMAVLSGSTVPERVLERLRPYRDDAESLRKAGVEVATELCDELLERGAPGLHFYTLNRSRATREIYANLKPRNGY